MRWSALSLLGFLAGCGEIYEAPPTELSLHFSGAVPVRLQRPSGELRLQRGAALTAEETVQLEAPGDALTLSASSVGTWSNTVEVSFAAGAVSSSAFFARGQVPGSVAIQVSSNELGQRVVGLDVGTTLLADDFESGLLTGPGAQWDDVTAPPPHTLQVATQAAHRGLRGLEAVDGDDHGGAPGSGPVTLLTSRTAAHGGDHFLRAWVRILPASQVGSIIPLTVIGSGSSAALEVKVALPAGSADPGGYDDSGAYLQEGPGPPVADGQWHLFELAVRGMGTASGERATWIDGTLVARRATLNFSSQGYEFDTIGIYWSDDLRFTGTVHFDDVRIGVTPLASQLRLSSESAASGCAKVTVSLVDSDASAGASAPYDVELELRGLQGPLYRDARCSQQTASLVLPAGQSSLSAFVETSSHQSLVAAHPDFLSSAPLELQPASGCASTPTGAPSALLVLALALALWRRA